MEVYVYKYYVIFDHNKKQLIDKLFPLWSSPDPWAFLKQEGFIPKDTEDPEEHGFEIIQKEIFSYGLRKKIKEFVDLLSPDFLSENDKEKLQTLMNEIVKILGSNHKDVVWLSTTAFCEHDLMLV